MALIKCPECGKEVSDKAITCINCGFPLTKPKSELTIYVKDKNLGLKRKGMFFFYDGKTFFDEILPGQTKHYEVKDTLNLVVGHKRGSLTGCAIKDSYMVTVVPGKETKLVAELAAWDVPMHYVLAEVDVIDYD